LFLTFQETRSVTDAGQVAQHRAGLRTDCAFARIDRDHLRVAADTSRSIIMAASNLKTLEGAPDA